MWFSKYKGYHRNRYIAKVVGKGILYDMRWKCNNKHGESTPPSTMTHWMSRQVYFNEETYILPPFSQILSNG